MAQLTRSTDSNFKDLLLSRILQKAFSELFVTFLKQDLSKVRNDQFQEKYTPSQNLMYQTELRKYKPCGEALNLFHSLKLTKDRV